MKKKMKEKITTALKAGAAFLGTHLICCSPLILPAAFGVTISGAYLGAISLVAIGGIYATSFIMYKNHSKKANKDKKTPSKCCKSATYGKSKSFKNASIIAAGVFLGAVFNQFAKHDHDHSHNHNDHHQQTESIKQKSSDISINSPLKSHDNNVKLTA